MENCGFFVNNANVVNITHWKSKILPHRWLQWKRRGFKFCRWVSCICSCHAIFWLAVAKLEEFDSQHFNMCFFPLGKPTGRDMEAWQHRRFHFLIRSSRLWLHFGWFRIKIEIVTPLISLDFCFFLLHCCTNNKHWSWLQKQLWAS